MMRATPILERNHFHLDTALYSHAFFLVVDETWELMARSRFSVSKPMICVLLGPPIQRTSFLAGITRDLRMFFAPGSRLQLLQVRQLFGTKVMLGLKTASDKSS